MGRFILTQNYKRLMSGESETYGSSGSVNYGCYKVHDITDTSDDNWIAISTSGTKFKVNRAATSESTATNAANAMGRMVADELRFQGYYTTDIMFGTGGSLLDENSYTADESAGTATTKTQVYAPSLSRLVLTYTNVTATPISFDQMHCIRSKYLTDTLQTGTISQSNVMYWAYDFGETITVAPNETVTFTIKIV